MVIATSAATRTFAARAFASLALGCALICAVSAERAAAFAGQNGRITFQSERDHSSGEIYSVAPDGSGPLRLTTNTAFDGGAAWSADGRRIAFATDRDSVGSVEDRGEIYAMQGDGTSPLNLTRNLGDDDNVGPGDSTPAWSPNGQRIAFVSDRNGGAPRLFVMNADGSGQVALAAGMFARDPAWSPDGTKIAFTGFDGSDSEIRVINADGTGGTFITANMANDHDPNWSPDGTQIAFVSDAGGNPDIHVMNADGTAAGALTTNAAEEWSPAFSPDGTKIVFGRGSFSDQDILVMETNGTDQAPLITGPGNDSNPDWGRVPEPEECVEEEPSPAGKPIAARTRAPARRPQPTSRVAPAAAGAATPAIREVRPRHAASGAAVILRGRGLRARGLRVTIGGRRATVLAGGTDRQVSVVVPRIGARAHRVVASRGRRRATASLRVVKPFDGRVRVRTDTRRAAGGTIGPAGGSVAATGSDRTRYELTIPPGALTSEQAITMTPVTSFTGLPFSGARQVGVRMGPNGLVFARPAKLKITARSGMRSLVGFSLSGRDLTVVVADGRGRSRTVEVDHFSEQGVSEVDPADFARMAERFRRDDLTRSQVKQAIDLIAAFESATANSTDPGVGPFCASQPLCEEITQRAIRSLRNVAQTVCQIGTAHRDRILELTEIQGEAAVLGETENFAEPCIEFHARAIVSTLKQVLADGPFGRISPPDYGRDSDIDADGEISAFEYGFAFRAEIQLLGLPNKLEGDLKQSMVASLDLLRRTEQLNCAQGDPNRARAALQRGFGYATASKELEAEFLAALRACGVDFVIVPPSAQVRTGGAFTFAVQFTDPALPSDLRGIAWSTNNGLIDSVGNYVAPGTEGEAEVRATSTANGRSATARVVIVERCSS